eukprot:7093967-Pyramimonas_sp.AAC.1
MDGAYMVPSTTEGMPTSFSMCERARSIRFLAGEGWEGRGGGGRKGRWSRNLTNGSQDAAPSD